MTATTSCSSPSSIWSDWPIARSARWAAACADVIRVARLVVVVAARDLRMRGERLAEAAAARLGRCLYDER